MTNKREIAGLIKYAIFTAAVLALLLLPCIESLPATASFTGSSTVPVYYPADDAAEQPLTVMAVTKEEHRARFNSWINAPRARMDSNFQRKLMATTSFTSVNNLNKIPDYSARSQGSAGNCWVWACTAAMEGEYYNQFGSSKRLSIQYFDSNYRNGAAGSWAGCGGDIPPFVDFYSSRKTCIPWSNTNAHYQDSSRACSMGTAVPASAIATKPGYTISTITGNQIPTFGAGQATAIARIKNVINQGKVPVFCFYLSSAGWTGFRNFWMNQPESALWSDFNCGAYPSGGHAVACVGYNDDSPDPEKHYWIMLNSWGTNALRPNGLFRVKMYYNYDCAAYWGYSMTEWWAIDAAFVPPAPSAPVLNSPAPGATVSGNPVFQWSASDGATGYWLTVRKAGDNSIVINRSVGANLSYTGSSFPGDGTQYRWTVAAGSSGVWTAADYQSFTSNAYSSSSLPPAPVLTSPASGTAVSGTSVTFRWGEVNGATKYWLSVVRATDNMPVYSKNVGNVASQTVGGFPNDCTVYRWTVAASNSAGGGPAAPRSTFINGAASTPAAAVLLSPAESASVSGGSVTFRWAASEGASGYWLTVRKAVDNSIVINRSVGTNLSYTGTGFPSDGTQYRWTVAAGSSGLWAAAAYRNFTSGP